MFGMGPHGPMGHPPMGFHHHPMGFHHHPGCGCLGCCTLAIVPILIAILAAVVFSFCW